MKHSWPVTFLSKRVGFLTIYKNSRHALAILPCALSVVMVLSATSKADTVSVYECLGNYCMPQWDYVGTVPLPVTPPAITESNKSGTLAAGSAWLDNISFNDPNTGFSFNGYASVNFTSAGVSGSTGSTTGEIDLFGTATSTGAMTGSLNIQVDQALTWPTSFTDQDVVAQSDFLTGSCNSAANSAPTPAQPPSGVWVLGTAGMGGYPPGNLWAHCSPGSTGFSLSNNPGSGGSGFALTDFNVSATFFFPADGSVQESVSIPVIGTVTAQGVLAPQNPPSTVPEPSTMALLGTGLLGILGLWHRGAVS